MQELGRVCSQLSFQSSASIYFFLRPFSFSPISYADLVYLTFCTFCALAIGWVSAVRRRAEQELRNAHDELEAKVLERTGIVRRSESYLTETQKLTHTGSWAWDVRSQKVLYCSEEMFRIYGLDPQIDLPTRKNFRQRVHPEDRNRVDERFARVVNERVDSFDEYRVLLPDGTIKHVNSSGRSMAPLRICGPGTSTMQGQNPISVIASASYWPARLPIWGRQCSLHHQYVRV